MGTGDAPLLSVGDRDPLGPVDAPAVLTTDGPSAHGVHEADVDFGSVRPAMWRLPIEAPPNRRSAATFAVGAALACHLGLLLALHLLAGQATEGYGNIEIPVEIVQEIPMAPASDRPDLPPLAPSPPAAITETTEPSEGDAPTGPRAGPAREAAEAQSVTPPPPAASSPPTVEDTAPSAATPMTASRSAEAEIPSITPPPPAVLVPPVGETAVPPATAPITAVQNLAPVADVEVAPKPPPAARPPRPEAPPAVVAPSRASSRETTPKAAETHAAIERVERQRLAAMAARQAQLAKDAAALQRAVERRRADRAAATTTARETVHATPAASAASAEDITAYSRAVLGRIAATKRYPEEARARGAQGTVVVAFSLGSAGQVTSASVRSSSGDASLDGEAVSTVRRAGPFGPPPLGAPRSLSVPLRYHI